MKIGIITQPLHTNYGGLLQNYALQQTLKRLGHDPITLDQGNARPSLWRICASCIKTFLLKLIGKGKGRQYPFRLNEERKASVRQHTNRFIEKYINHTEPFLCTEDFRNYTVGNELDALIVGSDQVWRPIYNQNVLRSFLDFAEGLQVRRLAYAASFGVDDGEFTERQTRKSRSLIRDFNAVSVREHSGIDLCRKYLWCDAVHVLDPTMLLDKEDYIRLVETENEPRSKGNLFTYILDASVEKQHIIDKVASELNLVPFTSMPENESMPFPPVTQWLRAFMDAEFVVCDSFHGAVFSIIFNKPFLIIGNKERGMTRFHSLLDTFELRNRMVDKPTDVHSIVNMPVDWKKVNRIRAEMRSYSVEFLKTKIK